MTSRPSRALLLAALAVAACDGAQSGRDLATPIGGGDARARDAEPLPPDAGPEPLDAAPDPEDTGTTLGPDADPAPEDAAADAGPVAPDADTTPDAAPGDSGLALANPLFVGVGYGGRRIISRDGVTWTNDVVIDRNGGDDNNLLRGAAWADGRFIAVGGAARGWSIISLDGITWTNEVREQRAFVSQPAFGNGVWVGVGGNGYRVRSLDHGVSWVDDAGYFAGHMRRVVFGRGTFVAVGHTYGATNHGWVGTTTDGRTWRTAEQPGLAPLWDVSFGNDVFVATGGQRITRSPDGVTWTEVTLTTAGVDSLGFANGEHLITTREGLWHSTDAIQWTRITGFAPSAIAYANGTYVGTDWRGQRYTSPDRTTWTPRGMPDGPGLTEIVAGDVP